jgi:glutamate/tyrosine decarboxylase-like PLP-dependent enzyme
MERNLMKYFGKLCGWKEGDIDGIFAPGGSMANIYGMILARHRKFPSLKKKGIRDLGELVIFCSEDSHYSYVKGSIWMGSGSESVLKVKTDARGRMCPEALEERITTALSEGKVPYFVGCTGGTTVLGAFDPLEPVSKICAKYGLWMHVDAALGGSVLFSKKHRHLLNGIEYADSMTWNLHKLAGIPLQCSAFITRHPTLLTEASSLNAEYLFQSDKYYDASYDSGDKSIQCGRKVDSLKLWLALAARGEREMERLVDNLFQVAAYVRDKIGATEGFRLVLPEFESNNVCFWYIPPSLRGSLGPDGLPEPALLSKVCPLIKGKMMEKGHLMVNYQPLTSKKMVNFFRLVLTCVPPSSPQDMDFFVDQIQSLGNQIQI